MRTKGKIIIYYGQGEGKTSAALGRAMRIAGYNRKVVILQLMKGRKTGEYKFLKRIQRKNNFPIEIYLLGPQTFLTKKADFLLHQKKVKKALSLAENILLEEKTNLLVLDEILYALKFKLITEKEIIDLLEKRGKTNIILTGQELTKNLRKRADQVSRISKIKHYFDKKKRCIPGMDY